MWFRVKFVLTILTFMCAVLACRQTLAKTATMSALPESLSVKVEDHLVTYRPPKDDPCHENPSSVSLVVHGLGQDFYDFENFSSYLAYNCGVVLAMRLPGGVRQANGKILTDEHVSPDDYVYDFKDLLNFAIAKKALLGASKLRIIAYSMGGTTILSGLLTLLQREAKNQELIDSIDEIFLFAPALNLTLASVALVAASSGVDSVATLNVSPRSRRVLSTKQIGVLEKLIDYTTKHCNNWSKISPVTVFISENDPWVSAKRVREMVNTCSQGLWQLTSINIDADSSKIVDGMDDHSIYDPLFLDQSSRSEVLDHFKESEHRLSYKD